MNNLASNVLFVAENGNDSTAIKGSLHYAWATVEKAVNYADPGDVVCVLPGIYTVNANIAKDGVGLQTWGQVKMTRSALRGVSKITISSGGSNYSPSDTVTFSSGTVTATGRLVVNGGAITNILLDNFGNYSGAAPTITINTSTGSGASITCSVSAYLFDIGSFTSDYYAGGEGLEIVANSARAISVGTGRKTHLVWSKITTSANFQFGDAAVVTSGPGVGYDCILKGDIIASNVGNSGAALAIGTAYSGMAFFGNVVVTGATHGTAAAVLVNSNYCRFTMHGDISLRASDGRALLVSNCESLILFGNILYESSGGNGYTIYSNNLGGHVVVNGNVTQTSSNNGGIYLAHLAGNTTSVPTFVFNGVIGVNMQVGDGASGGLTRVVVNSSYKTKITINHPTVYVAINGITESSAYGVWEIYQGNLIINGQVATNSNFLSRNLLYGGTVVINGVMQTTYAQTSLIDMSAQSSGAGVGYIRITNSGYYPSLSVPTITFSSGAAVATAIMSGPYVIGALVTTPGSYTGSTPTVTFSASGGDVAATGEVVIGGVLEVKGRVENFGYGSFAHGINFVSGNLILSGGVVMCADANANPINNRKLYASTSKFYGYSGAVNRANAAVAQVWSFTVNGPTLADGTVYTISVNGTSCSHTKIGGDTASTIAAGIAAQITSLVSGVVSVSGSGASRTLTAVTPGTYFSIGGNVVDLTWTEVKSNHAALTNEVTGNIIYDVNVK